MINYDDQRPCNEECFEILSTSFRKLMISYFLLGKELFLRYKLTENDGEIIETVGKIFPFLFTLYIDQLFAKNTYQLEYLFFNTKSGLLVAVR